MKIRAVLASVLLLGAVSSVQAEITTGFYAGANVIGAKHKAKNMEDSLPQTYNFTKEKDHRSYAGGSIAGGYKFDDIFRVELEYVFPKSNEYTSANGQQMNHHKIKSQRLMVNAIASYPINEQFSVYGAAGLGYAKLKSTGWQTMPHGDYSSGSNNNFAWSLGAGVSFKPIDNTYIDLGFRHVNLGKARTGNSIIDGVNKQQRAKLISNEFTLGVRYMLGELYSDDGTQPAENIYADHVTPELRENFEGRGTSIREAHAQEPLRKADGTSVPVEVKVIDWRQAPY